MERLYLEHTYDKDCLEDFRVLFTRSGKEIADNAINIKARNAEVLYVYTDVEEIPFNQGFYTIDIKFFYRVTLDAYTCPGRSCEIKGLVIFDKRVVLFGSEGRTKIFSSAFSQSEFDPQLAGSSNLPVAVVECVDPVVLDVKMMEVCNCSGRYCANEYYDMPEGVSRCFDDEIVTSGEEKRIFISLGQFSVVRLERDAQLLIPSYDFSLPEKECIGSYDSDPCDLFKKICFPADEFNPPDFSDRDNNGC